MLKSNETDLPLFRPPVTIKKLFDIEIDEELRGFVDKYLEARKGDGDTPQYGADPFLMARLRKEMQKVFGKETKVDKMADDDVVDSAITHAVEDKVEDLVPLNLTGAKILGLDPEKDCPEGFHVANVFIRLKGWEVGDATAR